MKQQLAELSARLLEVCEQAVRETDPLNQARLSTEIYRIIAECDRIRRDLGFDTE